MTFTEEFRNKTRAGYPAIYVVAREDWRALKEIEKVAETSQLSFGSWTATGGWQFSKTTKAVARPTMKDPLEAIRLVKNLPTDGIYALVNFHRYLDDPETIQTIKDLVQLAKSSLQTIVFVCNIQKLPQELLDDVALMDFGLPSRELIAERVAYMADSLKEQTAVPDEDQSEALIEAALGMTTWEAENALALSVVETKAFSPQVVSREKALAVSKDGILEFMAPLAGGLDNVGGLENLKEWLGERRGAFTKEARDYGLELPKGILLAGVPGCGKTLTAKAVAAAWNMPLLKFDLGKVFGSLVGSSEANMRKALQTAEAVAPVVLLIDEIEKGMAGAGGSGSTDSGVSPRVFGTFITWLNDKTRPVFVVASANRVLNLPPELMRAGRFDEVFWVDLPTLEERFVILGIHLKKRKRTPGSFGLMAVSEATEQFSGAELEGVVTKAMFHAFAQSREVDTKDLEWAAAATVPLAVTRKEEIESMREWAKSRAIQASRGEAPVIVEGKRRIKTPA